MALRKLCLKLCDLSAQRGRLSFEFGGVGQVFVARKRRVGVVRSQKRVIARSLGLPKLDLQYQQLRDGILERGQGRQSFPIDG